MLNLLRPFTGYIMGGMLFVILALGVALKIERVHSHKLAERNAVLTAKLEEISTKRNEQARRSDETVGKVVKGDPVVRTIVRTIREAPNPEGCRTPALDSLRNVL